jgi:hypothetical protein
VRLRQQALILLVATGCAGSAGCARLLGALAAPQQAAVSSAQAVAGRAAAPAQPQIDGLSREVGRLLGGDGGDRDELRRIQQELDRRAAERGGAAQAVAQDDPERRRPWHPRQEAPGAREALRPREGDRLVVAGGAAGERGLAEPGPLPDGTPRALPPPMIDLAPVRPGRR